MRIKFRKLSVIMLALIIVLFIFTIVPTSAGASENNSESVGDTYISAILHIKC